MGNPVVYLSIDQELDRQIADLAQAQGVKKTDLLRDLLVSGLSSEQLKQDLAIVEKERDGLKVKVSDLEKEHSEFMDGMTQDVAKALKAYDSRLQHLEEALGETQKIVVDRLTGFKEAIERLEKGYQALPGQKPQEKSSEHVSSGKALGETIETHLPGCKDCRESAFEALEPFMEVQDVKTCVDCHKPYEPKTIEPEYVALIDPLETKEVCAHCGSESEPEEHSEVVLLESPKKEEEEAKAPTEPKKPESEEHEYKPLI